MSRGLDFGAEHVRFSASDLTSKVVGLGIIFDRWSLKYRRISTFETLKYAKKATSLYSVFFFATEKKGKIL